MEPPTTETTQPPATETMQSPGIKPVEFGQPFPATPIRKGCGGHSVTPPPNSAAIAEAQRRFAICRACEHVADGGFACDLYKDCCFGKFRAVAANTCPAGKW